MENDESTILIVDDSEDNRALVAHHLRRPGYNIALAENGRQALAYIRLRPPDLVLLDIEMPLMNGYQFLGELRRDNLHCGIPVIVMSAHDEVENVVKCIQMGADDYLIKPLTSFLLQAKVEDCMEKKQAQRRAQVLGQYKLERRIGEGAMAQVYVARHSLLRRPTAIKILRLQESNEARVALFEREVQLTSGLSHPNTIAIYDYGRTPDGRFYYAMEYLDGIDLELLAKMDKRIAPARLIHILSQVCGSLSEAHHHGLVHRDVKPSNVMLCERGGIYDFVKVVDFGVVKTVEEGAADISLGAVGTPLYMSPEAYCAPASVDARSDIYAVGAMAYRLLAGEPLFDTPTVREMMEAHVNEVPDRPSKRVKEKFPKDLEKIIMRCLEKDPGRRPQEARLLQMELQGCRDAGK